MTAMIWFLLGLWAGCSAGFLLAACMAIARDGRQRAEAALSKSRSAARRVRADDNRVRMNLLRLRPVHSDL